MLPLMTGWYNAIILYNSIDFPNITPAELDKNI